ncbi:DNA polymerase V [Siccibacter colletis]|uniref:HumD family translesion DNA polymerase n=1 Tax=Siccibacter colletis TaxID=1505757 RepID=UPI00056A7969|nr:DNA polymerase V [Siccibacter colletis]
MGFPSPAQDYSDAPISLDALCFKVPSATYVIRAGFYSWREGIKHSALLIVDCSLRPCDGSLVLCNIDGVIKVRRYRILPAPRLECLDDSTRVNMLGSDEHGSEVVVRGVITYILNDARTGEFDDCPVM